MFSVVELDDRLSRAKDYTTRVPCKCQWEFFSAPDLKTANISLNMCFSVEMLLPWNNCEKNFQLELRFIGQNSNANKTVALECIYLERRWEFRRKKE